MIGQVVELASPGVTIQKRLGHLEVAAPDGKTSVDLDSVGAVVLSAPQAVVTRSILDELSRRSIPVLVCGSNYLPSAILVPAYNKKDTAELIRAQVDASRPTVKRIWQAIVREKIGSQATVLKARGNHKGAKRLNAIAPTVKSGDPSNREAYAAKLYWRELFGGDFHRDRNSAGINALLNYGYSILRSAVARGLAGVGLALSLGVHHSAARNAMCLVDDMMEPFRPAVDLLVSRIVDNGQTELAPSSKAELAEVLVADVQGARGVTTLQNGLWEFAASFAETLLDSQRALRFPKLVGVDDASADSIGV